MFIGRKNEFSVLEDTYKMPGFQMTVIYGRRRIGKSRLITEFIKGKKASYYVASKTSIEDNVKKWSSQVISDLAPNMEGLSVDNLEAFFNFVGNLADMEGNECTICFNGKWFHSRDDFFKDGCIGNNKLTAIYDKLYGFEVKE